MAQIDAVIFDLDGTLLDHATSARQALVAWLPELGTSLTPELTAAWFLAEEEHFAAWRSGHITFVEQRRRRLRDFLPLIGHPMGNGTDLDALFAGFLRHYEAAWICFDDVDAALREVAQLPVKIAILTNGAEVQQRAKLAAVGLDQYFDHVYTAEGLGAAKPDPSTYRRVCEAIDVEVGATLHVGDHYALDVEAPRRAGLQAVHLDRADDGPWDEPARIQSLSQLPALLRASSRH